MSAALKTYTVPWPDGIGFRHDARFEPDAANPCEVSLIGASGWRTAMKKVADVSMGGVSVILSAAETRQAELNLAVTVELELFGSTSFVPGMTVHRTRAGKRLFLKDREIGVRFQISADYDLLPPLLERYLQQLNRSGRRIGP
jgi:hypothetical protein